MMHASLLNSGLLKSNLHRFWPLWLAGFVALVLLFDMPLYGAAIEITRSMPDAFERMSNMEGLWTIVHAGSWIFMLVAAAVVALALGESLFDSRAATFTGMLPVSRKTVFVTTAISGLVMLLLVPAVACALLLPLCFITGPMVSLGALARCYALMAALGCVFYAFALLAGELSGSRPVALLLYAVMNFLAACLNAAMQLAVSALMYGLEAPESVLEWFSPAVRLLSVTILWESELASQVGILCGYVAVGIVALVFAGALFCRRDLEMAGESVAFAPLRPVLRYLAGISMALLFSSVYRMTRLSDAFGSLPLLASEAATMALLMAVGAFLGVLFAEMIMSRSARVLKSCWRGGAVLAVASLLFVGVCWFDPAGITRTVPAPEDVTQVKLVGSYADKATVTSPEGIADACTLHRDLIAYGGVGNRAYSTYTISFEYQLKNGRKLSRTYPVVYTPTDYGIDRTSNDEGTQLLVRFASLANSREGRASRYDKMLGANARKLTFQIDYNMGDGSYRSITLAGDELTDFIENGLRPDLMEEPAGAILGSEPWSEKTTLDATLLIFRPYPDYEAHETLYNLQLDREQSPHVVAWLEEHHPEIVLVPWR